MHGLYSSADNGPGLSIMAIGSALSMSLLVGFLDFQYNDLSLTQVTCLIQNRMSIDERSSVYLLHRRRRSLARQGRRAQFLLLFPYLHPQSRILHSESSSKNEHRTSPNPEVLMAVVLNLGPEKARSGASNGPAPYRQATARDPTGQKECDVTWPP